MRTTQRWIAAVIGVLATAIAASPAAAQDPPVSSGTSPVAVQPSGPDGPGGRDYFIYNLAPGETFGDTVAVSNLGDEPVRVALYATDAFNTEEGAAFTLLREEEAPDDVGAWIRLAANEYEIPPGARIDVPFVLTVPEDASPGDHAGGIVAQPLAPPAGSDSQFSFDVRLRVASRVYLRVDGETRPELRVTELALNYGQGLGPTSGRAAVNYVVRNTGNLRLNPVAQVRIVGPFGLTVRTLEPHQLPELLPGGHIEVADTADGLPLLGRLHVEVDVEAEGTDTRRSTATWAVPWLVVALLAVLAAGRLLWRRRRRHRRGDPPSGPPAGRTTVRAERPKELAGV